MDLASFNASILSIQNRPDLWAEIDFLCLFDEPDVSGSPPSITVMRQLYTRVREIFGPWSPTSGVVPVLSMCTFPWSGTGPQFSAPDVADIVGHDPYRYDTDSLIAQMVQDTVTVADGRQVLSVIQVVPIAFAPNPAQPPPAAVQQMGQVCLDNGASHLGLWQGDLENGNPWDQTVRAALPSIITAWRA